MIQRILLPALLGLTFALPAAAQNNSTYNSGQSTAGNQNWSMNNDQDTGQMNGVNSRNGHQIAQELRQSLSQAGFTNIHVMPESFLVRADDSQGNPVMMVVNPHSLTAVTSFNGQNGSQNSNNNGTNNAYNNGYNNGYNYGYYNGYNNNGNNNSGMASNGFRNNGYNNSGIPNNNTSGFSNNGQNNNGQSNSGSNNTLGSSNQGNSSNRFSSSNNNLGSGNSGTSGSWNGNQNSTNP